MCLLSRFVGVAIRVGSESTLFPTHLTCDPGRPTKTPPFFLRHPPCPFAVLTPDTREFPHKTLIPPVVRLCLFRLGRLCGVTKISPMFPDPRLHFHGVELVVESHIDQRNRAGTMSENTTAEFQDVVQALLNEDQLFSLSERRDNARKNFVRPVRIIFTRNIKDIRPGFTRDLSDRGIGLIHRFEAVRGDHAFVTINRLWDQPVVMRCRVAWCTKCENGWFQSGWEIVSVESVKSLNDQTS